MLGDSSGAGFTNLVVPQMEQIELAEVLRDGSGAGIANLVVPQTKRSKLVEAISNGKGACIAELLEVIMTESDTLAADKIRTVRHYQAEIARSLKAILGVIGGESRSHPRGTVLVADRHPALAELIEELLRSEGYRVVSFTDAASALKYCRVNSHSIDSAVIDDSLRDDRAGSLIEALTAASPGLGIVRLTENRESADAGAVAKPLDFQALLETLSAVSPPPAKG